MDTEDIAALLQAIETQSTENPGNKQHNLASQTRQFSSSNALTVEYNNDLYMSVYPDIAQDVADRKYKTGYHHYILKGKAEGRLNAAAYVSALGYTNPAQPPLAGLPFSIEAAFVNEDGLAFIVGWVDDRQSPLSSLSVISGTEGSNTRAFGRCRRSDVESLLGAPVGHSFGFWTLLQLTPGQDLLKDWKVRAIFQNGLYAETQSNARLQSDAEIRSTVLGYFASAEYYGNRDMESFHALETGLGVQLVELNRRISKSITATALVERFGPPRSSFKASIVVCLFGKHEFFFLQNLLFSQGKHSEYYEYIYVSNSPELSEILHKEARIAEMVYGINVTLVTLSGNAGFSAANNVAAKHALSNRVVFVNPDVFPMSQDWVLMHEQLLATLPKYQTNMFGALLYYDDGTLMHGGMHFEVDQGLSIKPRTIETMDMIRVEHYGKGAPAWSTRYTGSRPVPAITGAFVSADRSWFEHLGGFSEDHLFGHYEDADLCLRSLAQGVPVWMHDIKFWHLEGKGSVRRHEHEGGSLVNRWLFTRNWGTLIKDTLNGARPTHPLLVDPSRLSDRLAESRDRSEPQSHVSSAKSSPVAVRRRSIVEKSGRKQ